MTNHITLPRSDLQQLLDALCLPCDRWNGTQTKIINAAIEVARAALAAQQAEPVAWGVFHFGGKLNGRLYSHCDTKEQAQAYIADRHQSDDQNTFRAAPLYTTPQPAQPVAVPQVKALFAAIEHGDEDHRAWLKQALDDFYAGREVQHPEQPPPAAPTPPAATVPVPEPLTRDEIVRIAMETGLQSSEEHWGTVYRAIGPSNLESFAAAIVEAAHNAKLAKRGGV